MSMRFSLMATAGYTHRFYGGGSRDAGGTAAFPITVMASFGPSTGHAGTSGARRVSSVGYLWAEGRDGEGKVKNSFLLCSRGR